MAPNILSSKYLLEIQTRLLPVSSTPNALECPKSAWRVVPFFLCLPLAPKINNRSKLTDTINNNYFLLLWIPINGTTSADVLLPARALLQLSQQNAMQNDVVCVRVHFSGHFHKLDGIVRISRRISATFIINSYFGHSNAGWWQKNDIDDGEKEKKTRI